jgi:transcriptional regulator MraZ
VGESVLKGGVLERSGAELRKEHWCMAEKSSEKGPEQPVYAAVYRHGVDEKRRLQIPSKWRIPGQDMKWTLVIWPSGWQKDACLMVLPPPVMESMIAKLAQGQFNNADSDALRRFIGARSDMAILDKAGRICLPDTMAKSVGIEKEAVMVGMLDRFQIWNPEQFERSQAVVEEMAAKTWSAF